MFARRISCSSVSAGVWRLTCRLFEHDGAESSREIRHGARLGLSTCVSTRGRIGGFYRRAARRRDAPSWSPGNGAHGRPTELKVWIRRPGRSLFHEYGNCLFLASQLPRIFGAFVAHDAAFTQALCARAPRVTDRHARSELFRRIGKTVYLGSDWR